MAISSGEQADHASQTSNATEDFDWLYLQWGDLDEETVTYLLRLTMRGQDWICWQVTERWW